MKGGTIVPEGILAIGPPPGDVRDDPVYPVCLCAKPIARRAQTFRAYVEHRQIPVTLFDQQIDQARRTAADVDNGGVQRNPRTALAMKGGEPLPASERDAFARTRGELIALLDRDTAPKLAARP